MQYLPNMNTKLFDVLLWWSPGDGAVDCLGRLSIKCIGIVWCSQLVLVIVTFSHTIGRNSVNANVHIAMLQLERRRSSVKSFLIMAWLPLLSPIFIIFPYLHLQIYCFSFPLYLLSSTFVSRSTLLDLAISLSRALSHCHCLTVSQTWCLIASLSLCVSLRHSAFAQGHACSSIAWKALRRTRTYP